jgi:hypothetical protein
MRRLWLSLVVALALAVSPGAALAINVVPPGMGGGGTTGGGTNNTGACDPKTQPCFSQVLNPNDKCGGVQIALPFVGNNKCVQNGANSGGAIITYTKTILQFLTASIGVIIILMLTIAGIQYVTSAGDAARIKAAKSRIQWAIIALLMFMAMYAILTFLIPGGIL